MKLRVQGTGYGVRAVVLRYGCLAIFVASMMICAPAMGESAAELRGKADAIGAEAKSLGRAGALSTQNELGFVARLGSLVLGFIEESDSAARAGTEQRKTLRPVFESIHGPLNRIYTDRSDRLERMAREIMEVDGDLDALYESRQWRESQRVAAESLYYLNWLGYYGARLYDGRRRKELFETAERGFSQFAVGERSTDLVTESLLGRALCHLELGNYEWAVRDFRIVLEEPGASVERKAKASLGLLESFVRSGSVDDALSYSQRLLDSGSLSGGETVMVRFFRLQTLFAGMKKASGADAQRYRREASSLMHELRRAGRGWADKVDALMLSSIDDPAQWANKAQTPFGKWQLAKMLVQQGKELEAVPLLEELIASQDSSAAKYRPEARYLLGMARFKAGDYDTSAQYLTRALEEGKGADFVADAAYLRFKALEALMVVEPTPELASRYVAALGEFLAQYPSHASAPEARYRLGEYLQAQREFAAAIEEYGRVQGDTALEVRATFGRLQSEFELLRESRTRQSREELAENIRLDLGRFWDSSVELDKQGNAAGVPLREFQATVMLFQAAYHSLRGTDDDEQIDELLADFVQRFPEQRDLHPQAARMRLGALQRLGRFAAAEKLVREQGGVLVQDGRVDLMEGLAQGFMRDGVRCRQQGDPQGGKAADMVARLLFEALPEDQAGQTATKLSLARLCESTGDIKKAEKLYNEILQEKDNSPVALQGLARVSEMRGDLSAAAGYWRRFTEVVRPGDRPWYEGQYQQARITLQLDGKNASCTRLEALRPSMPGLGDEELRGQFSELWKQACE